MEIFQDWLYSLFLLGGLFCYWAHRMDHKQQTDKKKGMPFLASHFILDNLWNFLSTNVLTILCMMIFLEFTWNNSHAKAYIYLEVFALSWGGGSMFRYAFELLERTHKTIIDKFTENYRK